MSNSSLRNSSLQRRYLPSYAVLRSFEAAARHQSFTLAAKELHLTQSAISRQVKELEQVIGVDLFRRTGRRVILSEAGKNLANNLSLDLENIRQTVLRAIAAGEQGSSLKIAILPTFANRWLIPRLADFTKKYPNIAINISTKLKPFDLSRENFDIAIHFGTNDWPDTKMVPIFEEEMIAVCSPKYKEKNQIADIEQLKNLDLLHLETRPLAWAEWFKKSKIDARQSLSGTQFDQFSMLIAGALASLGAALLPKYLIEKELKAKSLIQLGKASLNTNNSYFIVTQIGNDSDEILAFITWIKSQVSKI